MTTHGPSSILIISLLALTAGQSLAVDIPVAKDLSAVIALQGLPCGRVVSVKQQASNDYLAACDGGHRYRVFINADGRVIAEIQAVTAQGK
ncbi:MAG: hypothetical protein HYX63_12500 [Gammaproteobacteria bacterium]|nr:hypothetical protein [Gammaproteobacteria bacterium]